ncbi:hypothetical protein TWF106_003490 [Orbilia oligospora]|uniref:Uncharacterized protein n=1 Tax=Orbilia oligospora TaxID=2813651 RepID=A0A6G1M4B2_ORBOL|nr:hypothetical protein TWF788_008019 [Orbilia oligospora]KAF3200049.1 hypothetical protein TWF106_003490 [Orbilia oligospora]KAF3201866.1 hypothetical protein TWF191_003221 [Orbilia oligospora]KAF3205679.1 hypothetical protein TWF679_009230 [Orbilia oligospora]KAF3243243.1 hypothetical protein TWF192_008416 [Orbilia oligospora]
MAAQIEGLHMFCLHLLAGELRISSAAGIIRGGGYRERKRNEARNAILGTSFNESVCDNRLSILSTSCKLNCRGLASFPVLCCSTQMLEIAFLAGTKTVRLLLPPQASLLVYFP